MNQTNTVSAPRTKTYEITMTALMAAVTCILAPLSIPIGPVPISFTNLAIYLSSDIFRIYRRPCKAGRSYRRIHHRLYRYGCYCRTGN